MQETFDPNTKQYFQEFFEQGEGEGETEFVQRMDDLASARGHTVVKRRKVGRNELCPCGSGKKFKKCCIEEACGWPE